MPRKKATKKEQINQTSQAMNLNQTETMTTSYPDDTEYDKIDEIHKELTVSVDTEPELEQPNEPKRRGRKKKIEPIETVEIDFSVLFDIIVKRLPNPQALTELEKTLINKSANKVYNKYYSTFAYTDEINLALVIFSVTYPRLKKINDNANNNNDKEPTNE